MVTPNKRPRRSGARSSNLTSWSETNRLGPRVCVPLGATLGRTWHRQYAPKVRLRRSGARSSNLLSWPETYRLGPRVCVPFGATLGRTWHRQYAPKGTIEEEWRSLLESFVLASDEPSRGRSCMRFPHTSGKRTDVSDIGSAKSAYTGVSVFLGQLKHCI